MFPIKHAWQAFILAILTLVSAGGTVVLADGGPRSPQQGQEGLAVPLTHDNLASPDGTVFTVPLCSWVDPSGAGGLRPNLAVGVNNFGTFIDAPGAGATGFQMPIGPGQESLAAGWYGEGWAIDFGAGFRSYYLSGPQLGPIERVDDYWVESARYVRYVATVFLPVDPINRTQGLTVDFEFVIDRQTCDVTLRTTIENDIPGFVNVDYKRVVDWDIYFPTSTLGFSNCWQNTPDGVLAWLPLLGPLGGCTGPVRVECATTAFGQQPYAIDLDAWDDYWGTVGPGGSYVTSFVPILGDYNAGFNYAFTLAPGGSWSTFLKYSCTAY